MIHSFLVAALFLAVLAPTAAGWARLLRAGLGIRGPAAGPIALGLSLASFIFVLHSIALLVPFDAAALATTVGLPCFALPLVVPRVASFLRSAPALVEQHRRRLLAWAGGVVGAVLYLWPTWSWWDFHDAFTWMGGHAGLSLEMANGIYPPRNMSLASEPAVYHYAVDLFFAAGVVLTGYRIDRVIDGIALALWFVVLAAAYGLGRALWSRRAGAAAAVLLATAGGFPWLWGAVQHAFDRHEPVYPHAFGWLAGLFDYDTGGNGRYGVDQPFVSNFFQYPWAVATTLLLAVVALMSACFQPLAGVAFSRRLGRAAVLLAQLAALAFAETAAFFSVVGGLLLLAFGLAFRRRRIDRTSLELATVVGAALLCALALPGPPGIAVQSALHRLPGFRDLVGAPSVASVSTIHVVRGSVTVFMDKLGWNLGSLGFLLVGLWVLSSRPVRTTVWGAFALATVVVGLFCTNVFYYSLSWDIVKFATPAQIILPVAIAGLIAERPRLGSRRGALVALVAAGVCAAGLLYQLAYFWLPNGSIGSRTGLLHRVSGDEITAIRWLRGRALAGQSVGCSRQIDLACAALGGLPQVRLDDLGRTLPYSPIAAERLAALRSMPTVTRAVARSYRLCWLVDSPGRPLPIPGLAYLAKRSPVFFASGAVRVRFLC